MPIPLSLTPTQASQGLNLQGGYNPQQVLGMNSSATAPTTPKQQYTQQVANSMQNLSGQFAMVPGQNGQPATIYNKSTGQGYSNSNDFANAAGLNPNNINWNNLQFDTSWKPQANNGVGMSFTNGNIDQLGNYNPNPPPPSALPQVQPLAGASGGQTPPFVGTGASSNVYDPYNTPAYQQYVSNFAASQAPALTQSQYSGGIASTQQQLADIQKIYATNSNYDLNNPNLSQGALTGQLAAEAQVAANKSIPLQTLLGLYQGERTAAGVATGAPLSAANTEASYLAGQAKPQTLGPGQSLVLPNLNTGQGNVQSSVGSYGLGTGIAGQPITYSQTTGQIGGLGSTPPALGGQAGEQGALQSVASTYGLTDPASQLALKTAVDNTVASNGDVNAAGVPANLQPAVKAVLSQMTGGQYSPGNASINQANLTAEQAAANVIKPIAKTAVDHLGDLQSLADAVGYSNSPIANNIAKQFSNSILSDPKITTLSGAIGIVRAELAKVLGGGIATDSSRDEANAVLPDNVSSSVLKNNIATAQKLMNDKITEYSNPSNAVSLPNGLNNNSSTPPPTGTFTLQ